jgi:hypothetical protein
MRGIARRFKPSHLAGYLKVVQSISNDYTTGKGRWQVQISWRLTA